MEGKNYLGIYIGKQEATIVCLGIRGRDKKVLGCFSVGLEETPEQADSMTAELTKLIAQGCVERGLNFSEVAVALNCAEFMQHDVHSEFTDHKQIASTIRFDAEEALAADITDVAISFKVASSNETGSDLSVFTAKQKVLSEIILSLQANNMDPVTIEPDINCFSRFITETVFSVRESQISGGFFAAFSRQNGYYTIVKSAELQHQSLLRTFLVSPKQNRGQVLLRDWSIMKSWIQSEQPLNSITVLDSADTVDCGDVGQKTGVEVHPLDLKQLTGIDAQSLADCDDPVHFVIAYGAATAFSSKIESANFRSDFMPYLGKKQRLEKFAKLASIAAVILIVAIGVYLQLHLLQRNKYLSQLQNKFSKQYLSVMTGQNKVPSRTSEAVGKLKRERRRVLDVQSGGLSATGQESVVAKLTFVLKAFNGCAAKTKLNIDSVSITPKSISVVGDTASKKNTLALFESIKKSGLQILQQNLASKGGRDSFSITVSPKK